MAAASLLQLQLSVDPDQGTWTLNLTDPFDAVWANSSSTGLTGLQVATLGAGGAALRGPAGLPLPWLTAPGTATVWGGGQGFFGGEGLGGGRGQGLVFVLYRGATRAWAWV